MEKTKTEQALIEFRNSKQAGLDLDVLLKALAEAGKSEKEIIGITRKEMGF